MGFLTARKITPEWMDATSISHDELKQGASFIRKLNAHWGGRQLVLGHLKSWSRSWRKLGIGTASRPVTIIDLATGSADIPLAIVRWARAQGFEVRIMAVDLRPDILAIAKEHIGDEPWITLLAANALKLPFGNASFDYAIASLFLHHLPDIEVMTMLRIMEELSTRGMIWSDLCRSPLLHQFVKVMTLKCSEKIRHDAVVSVEAGFSKAEVLSLRHRLGLGQLGYSSYWGIRFTLAGEHRGLRA